MELNLNTDHLTIINGEKKDVLKQIKDGRGRPPFTPTSDIWAKNQYVPYSDRKRRLQEYYKLYYLKKRG